MVQLGSSGEAPSSMHTNLPPHSIERDHCNQSPRYGFVAKLKFRSALATINSKKTDDALAGTHHLFHSKKYFVSYERVEPMTVESAINSSKIVGKGQIYLPVLGGMYIEAYQTPDFAEDIL